MVLVKGLSNWFVCSRKLPRWCQTMVHHSTAKSLPDFFSSHGIVLTCYELLMPCSFLESGCIPSQLYTTLKMIAFYGITPASHYWEYHPSLLAYIEKVYQVGIMFFIAHSKHNSIIMDPNGTRALLQLMSIQIWNTSWLILPTEAFSWT